MNKFSRELIESLIEAVENAEGRPIAIRVHVVDVPGIVIGDKHADPASTSGRMPPRRMG